MDHDPLFLWKNNIIINILINKSKSRRGDCQQSLVSMHTVFESPSPHYSYPITPKATTNIRFSFKISNISNISNVISYRVGWL